MIPFKRWLGCAGIVAVALAGFLTTADRAFAQFDVVGHVYVNDNSSPGNTIAAFDRHSDGSLTLTAGSPFAAGGSGAAVPSQGALQLAYGGRYLLAVDAGSNQVSVLRVFHDGSLHPVEGSPFWSGGVEPVSIAVHGAQVVVANDGNTDGGANYSEFYLNPGGHLTQIPWGTYTLPAPTTVGDVLFSPDGRHLVGTRVNSSLIDSFTVTWFGVLVPASGSPFAAQGYGPFGSKFRPTNGAQLYVSNAHNAAGGPAPGTVSAFHVGDDGSFSSIGASPYPTGQTAACWIDISHSGRLLFAVNTGSNSISSFWIAADGSLQLAGNTILRGAPGNLGALDTGIDSSDHYLYVVERGANAVAGLQVNSDGSTAELPGSPIGLPTGSTAFGIVVD